MSHAAQRDFFARVKRLFPRDFHGATVLECGSLNVNGTLRDFFVDGTYLGVDIRFGPGVDLVMPVHALRIYKLPSFSIVVSAEMLEHDEHWQESLKMMYQLLAPGGLLVLSAAAPGRAEHGTTRAPDNEPGFDGLWGTSPDYYRPISREDLHQVFDLDGNQFFDWELEINDTTHDIYFWGRKRS